jgi:hypothetical protein
MGQITLPVAYRVNPDGTIPVLQIMRFVGKND